MYKINRVFSSWGQGQVWSFRAKMRRTNKEHQAELVDKIKVAEEEKSKPRSKPHPIIKKLLWSSMSFSIAIIYLNVSWTIITVQSLFF